MGNTIGRFWDGTGLCGVRGTDPPAAAGKGADFERFSAEKKFGFLTVSARFKTVKPVFLLTKLKLG